MNDIIAKRTNDAYLIRCAQILNNKRYIQSHNVKGKDGKERTFYFITAEGIENSEGTIEPFEDGLNTIAFVRNSKSITMMLLNTDYRIKLYADDDRCYYCNEKLGIQFRFENIFLGKDNSIEKNYFELKGPNSSTSATYAINEDSIVEIIYYYEMKKDCDGDIVQNSIINSELKNFSDEEIEEHMKELHTLYVENQPEEADELGEAVDLSELQNDDSMPDKIKEMLKEATEKREAESKSKTSGEFGLGNSIVLNTASRKERIESNSLFTRVFDMYTELYTQANLDMDDCFDVVDLFGNNINTRDYEIEERPPEYDYDYDDDDEESENPERNDFIEDDCERFDFYRKETSEDPEEDVDEDVDSTKKINISPEEKRHIISTITWYIMERNFEFSDILHLIQPMMEIFKEIESDYKARTCVDKDISDN